MLCAHPLSYAGQVVSFLGPHRIKTQLISKNLSNSKIFRNGITLRKLSERHQFGAEFLDKRNWARVARGRNHVRLWRATVITEHKELRYVSIVCICIWCIYMCVHVHMYVYVYTRAHTHTHAHTHAHSVFLCYTMCQGKIFTSWDSLT